MKRLLLLTILIASLAHAADDSFAVQRKKFAVDKTLRIDQISGYLPKNFTGARIIELRATVKGSYASPGMCGILLEHPSADPLALETEKVPDWLVGVEREARFIVRAERSDPAGPLRLSLISAAPLESAPDLMAAKPVVKPVAKAVTPRTPVRQTSALTSRSKGRAWTLPASEVTPIYASFIQRQNRNLSDAEALQIAQGVIGFSVQYGVETRLIVSMIMAESGFDPRATSRSGAMGLGQLMPKTANGLGVRSAYDIAENLYGMIKHVRRLLVKYTDQTGDPQRALQLSLAAYNAGEGNVKKYGGIPPFRETQNYVRKIIGIYAALTGSR